jgi:hypothetical protein
LAAGDFAGDVDEDLLIAMVSGAGTGVLLLENAAGELTSLDTFDTSGLGAKSR